jgi:hypothetical protein
LRIGLRSRIPGCDADKVGDHVAAGRARAPRRNMLTVLLVGRGIRRLAGLGAVPSFEASISRIALVGTGGVGAVAVQFFVC